MYIGIITLSIPNWMLLAAFAGNSGLAVIGHRKVEKANAEKRAKRSIDKESSVMLFFPFSLARERRP